MAASTPADGGAVITLPFVVLTVGATIYFTAQGMLFPTLPRFVEDELSGGGLAVGLTIGSFAIGAIVARPLAGLLADRVGRRLVVAVGASVWALTVLAYVTSDSWGGVPAVIGLRIIGGLGSGAMFVALAAIATDIVPTSRRLQGFSLFSVSILLGFAIGPIFGELVVGDGRFGLTFTLAAALAAALVISMALIPETRTGVSTQRGPLLHPAGVGPGSLLVLGSFGFISFTAFVPLHAEDLGIDSVAGAFTVVSGVTLATRLAGAGASDRVDRVRLATASMLLVAGGATVLAVWASLAGIYVGAVFYGLGTSFLFPAFVAMTIDAAPDEERAAAIGTITAFNDLAHSAGGALLGAVSSVAGYRGAFATAAVCGALGATLLTTRAPRLRPAAVRR